MNKTIVALGLTGAILAAAAGARAGKLEGKIRIDGSSTVYPITEAVAEEFGPVQPHIRVTVGVSGSGGGFKKFTVGETDISDASRPIKDKEMAKAKENGIEYIELPVAFDGISVVVNPQNEWCTALTTEELYKIWNPDSSVHTWKDVRATWPDRPIKLYGPGTDSGTFDYFTEAINGKAQSCRSDFTASEDDNVLVQGVAGDVDALGFFGFAYYVENTERLKIVPIDHGQGPVAPSMSTISSGTYQPLSRPIFIYVAAAAAQRPEVAEFVRFYLQSAPSLVREVGYVPLPEKVYELATSRFENRVTGSAFAARESNVGLKLEDLLTIQ